MIWFYELNMLILKPLICNHACHFLKLTLFLQKINIQSVTLFK